MFIIGVLTKKLKGKKKKKTIAFARSHHRCIIGSDISKMNEQQHEEKHTRNAFNVSYGVFFFLFLCHLTFN